MLFEKVRKLRQSNDTTNATTSGQIAELPVQTSTASVSTANETTGDILEANIIVQIFDAMNSDVTDTSYDSDAEVTNSYNDYTGNSDSYYDITGVTDSYYDNTGATDDYYISDYDLEKRLEEILKRIFKKVMKKSKQN